MTALNCLIDALADITLIDIFQRLHSITHEKRQHDLFTCVIVCRRWHHLAIPVLWQSLHLDLNPIQEFTKLDRTAYPKAVVAQPDLFELNSGSSAFPTWGLETLAGFTNALGVRASDMNRLYDTLLIERRAKGLQAETIEDSGSEAKRALNTKSVTPSDDKNIWPLDASAYRGYFTFVRYISVWLDAPTFRYALDKCEQIIAACTNLRRVDASFGISRWGFHHLSIFDQPKLMEWWDRVTQHLSTQRLESFRLRLAVDGPYSLFPAPRSNWDYCLPPIYNSLTEFRIVQTEQDVNFAIHHISRMAQLKHFTYYIPNEMVAFTEDENRRFWEALDNIKLESFSFFHGFPAWKTPRLPPTLEFVRVGVENKAVSELEDLISAVPNVRAWERNILMARGLSGKEVFDIYLEPKVNGL